MANSSETPHVLLFAGPFAVRGQCAYTLRLARNLPAYGFRAQVVCPDARSVAAEFRGALHIREYPYLLQPILGHVVQEILLRKLSVDPPDVIHAQTPAVLPAATWIARQLDRPLVVTFHDYLTERASLRIDRHVCRGVITVCDAVRDDLAERQRISPQSMTVIPSGVGCPRSEPLESVLQPSKVPVIGTAGPLEAVKGFPYFLNAASRVLATGRDVEFLVAGAGPEEHNLRRLSRELGIGERVTFLSNLLDFSPAMEAMDIFCLPSLRQGWGTVLLEAMALGRPVISTDVGGMSHVVRDGETGLLAPPSDSSQLAARMLELLDDPVKARRMGQAARAEVTAEYNVEQMVERTVDVYRTVMEQQAVAA